MDKVSNSAVEAVTAYLASYGNPALALLVHILLAWLIVHLVVRYVRQNKNQPSTIQTRTGTTSGGPWADDEEPLPAEFVAAATVGSDYYVPSSDELTGEIKVNIFDRQKRDALQLARELVCEYRRRVESGEAKNVYFVIANPLVADYNVMKLCESLLQKRGWSARDHGNSTAFVGPIHTTEPTPFCQDELQQIAESNSFASLIQSNILAPRKALAVSLAKQLVDGYRQQLGEAKPTSQVIAVCLAETIDHNVLTEVENILAPRGWAINYFMHSSYHVWPTEKRDRPARRGYGVLL